ncbi:MAG: UbiD family decarboxylase [Desulfobacterales bacterium]|jgi:4-hydroxy-3-polyprenylbenzoate decarboxylase|nr:UbiD family decarboxylase [Desulfobacterales bacterium]|tara:strand:- start:1127 stop:2596 length:1470 start_codon:yes stop_codon:yes gene_type:complete
MTTTSGINEPGFGAGDWLTRLQQAGELHTVSAEVDWDLELAEIAKRSGPGPALEFSNIKDHKDSIATRVLINGISSKRRILMLLQLPDDTSNAELVVELRKRIAHPIAPDIVEFSRIKENIIKGSDIDLYQFPIPKWNPLDGGRYIDNFAGTVTRDPETGELNLGVYRGMIASRNRISKLLQPHQHWGIHYQKYKALNREMPVAVVYGSDDIIPIVGGSPFSHPPDEYTIAGGFRQAPIQLIKCETNDLLVPADAEFVIEGRVSTNPDDFHTEGPFGEWTGFYGWSRKRPTIEVDCITHRNNPIFRAGGLSEIGRVFQYILAALMWDYLEKAGVPGVLDIMTTAFGTVVKIQKRFAGHARHVAATIFGSLISKEYVKVITVVDDDVDIHDQTAVQRAMHHRIDFKDDVVIFPGMGGTTLDPASPDELRNELMYGATPTNKVLFDATIDWVKHPIREEYGNQRFPPSSHEQDPDIIDLVDRRWTEYGIGD